MFPQYDIQASYREKLEGIVGLPAGLKEQEARAKGNLKITHENPFPVVFSRGRCVTLIGLHAGKLPNNK